MENQKVLNVSNEANNSKSVTRKWNIVNVNLKANYDLANEITYNTEVWKYSLRDYNDAFILVKDYISVTGASETQVAFKNCAPFITKIDEKTIDDAENFDLVMLMYNLIDYSSNYFETIGNFWFYSEDEATDFNANDFH